MLRIAEVENGKIKGLPAADPRITSFKGIPFAATPTGENRWRAPQPANDWKGVFKAFEFAPISMQAQPGINKNDIYTREWAVDPDIPMDEDCLYLNVWTPAGSADEKLPVYVWYFGGGLQVGNTAEMEFDGERIARRGIVVVTINYRLNVFGFLAHPEMTAENPEAPTNFGHLDQQFGTQWVKRNIEGFGGDPDNITIGGQSAGGVSVLCQLVSPQNENLFQKAIVQSGVFTQLFPTRMAMKTRTLEEAEHDGIKFFEKLGVKSLSQARKLDADFIIKTALELNGFWGSVIDGNFCTGNAFDLFMANKRWPAPVMLGHTSNEFIISPDVENKQELYDAAKKVFGDGADEFIELCGGENGSLEEMKQTSKVNIIEYSVRIACHANALAGGKTPFYYYSFDADIPGWDAPGAFHSIDLWFFFETLAKCWRPFVGKHYDLARQMCNYWCNFIKSGDPNGKDSTGEDMPEWQPYTPDAPYGMVFGDKSEFVSEEPSKVMQFYVKQYFENR